MAHKLCCICFPCFVPPDDSHPSADEEESSSSEIGTPLLHENPAGDATSSSSSSAPTVHDDTQKLYTVADANADGEKVIPNLDDLICCISHVLEKIQDPKPPTDYSWRTSTSSGSLELKDFVSAAANCTSCLDDLIPVGIGVVAKILERWEDVSENQEEWVCVLKNMNTLATHIKNIDRRPQLREEMNVTIKEATTIIEKQFTASYKQMTTCMILRFFFSSVNNIKLHIFRQESQRILWDIHLKIAANPTADGEKVILNLGDLIDCISQVLESIQKKHPKPATEYSWRSTWSVPLELKDFVAAGAKCVSDLDDVIPVGVRVVANILERWEDVSDNQEECLCVLNEMKNLATYLKRLEGRPSLSKEMSNKIKEATAVIVKQSTACYKQMATCTILRVLFSSVNKKKLDKFREESQNILRDIHQEIDLLILDLAQSANDAMQDLKKSTMHVRPKAPELERPYPEYAVGIEKPMEDVIALLDCKSNKRTLAVVLHGFGGIGKTTLAKAVFAKVKIDGWKYSTVTLFEDIKSSPNIVALQKTILRHLMHGCTEREKELMPDITTFQQGQEAIAERLKKDVAFIYIDNVFREPEGSPRFSLEMLLPWDRMQEAKKVRLLLTARDRDVVRGCRMARETVRYHQLECLPKIEALNLLIKELQYSSKTNDKGQLNSSQLDDLVDISGGIPKLLSVIAGFILVKEDPQLAYEIIKEDKDKQDGQLGDLGSYLFAYDHLPEMVKESFLDIYSFFIGWPWNTVQDIVGVSNLNVLQKISLVTKDALMTTRVHDVILTIGQQRKGKRFKFTSAREFEEEQDIQGIEGLWFNEYMAPFSITSTKLDSMCNSLKILSLGSSVKVKGDCKNTFKKLVFFKGRVPYPFNRSHSKELKYLECEARNMNFLKEMPWSLRHMELHGRVDSEDAFEISSTDLQQLRNLRTLKLDNFRGLKQLPEELGNVIKDLEELCLFDISIEKLPTSISKLQYLKVLEMFYCSSLKELPGDLESFNSLKKLVLRDCGSSLKVSPSSLDKLIELRCLNLSQWINIFIDLCELDKLDPKLRSHLQEYTSLKATSKELCSQRIRDYVESMNDQRVDDTLSKVIQGILSYHIQDFNLDWLDD